MENNDFEFFKQKKPWSEIKYKILADYLPGYLRKVATIGEKIVIVDAFAGPGKFEDGSDGSPLLICKYAERFSPGKYVAILINREYESDQQLKTVLEPYVKMKVAFPIHGTAQDLLVALNENLKTQTLFLYLDPFGLKGCEFSTILPYLQRNKSDSSTELLIRLDVSTIQRMSCCNSEQEKNIVKSKQASLIKVLGGDYWKEHMMDFTEIPYAKVDNVVINYCDKLRQYLPIVGYCPVPEASRKTKIKYYLIFASRHRDAAVLMNDAMFKAYWQYKHHCRTFNTFFESTDWKSSLPPSYGPALRGKILQVIKQEGKISRINLWHKIVADEFMTYHQPDFKKAVKELDKIEISFIDVKGTRKLNDESVLYILPKQEPKVELKKVNYGLFD